MRLRGFGPAAIAVAMAFIALPAVASAADDGVLARHTMAGQAIPCVAQPDGVRVCHGAESGSAATDLRLKSFDGAPLALYVTLPPASASGRGGDYPLIVQSHGWGDPPSGPNDAQYGGPTADQWAKQGYAVVQLAARGWGDSCGTAASRLVNTAACDKGFLRLDDYRYEARDVQYVAGLLVDAGIVDRNRIGVTGESYGGGVTLELATLNDRVMNADGSLSRWKSPAGKPLHIAAAAPFATWSDLAYSLMPNGRTFDAKATSPTADFSPLGVEKSSIDGGLYLVGSIAGHYAPEGSNPQSDVITWFKHLSAGEPYTSAADRSMIRLIERFHSPYYLLDGDYGTARRAPAPLLLANGFTDDIFPVDESLRYYNLDDRVHRRRPGDRQGVRPGPRRPRVHDRPGDRSGRGGGDLPAAGRHRLGIHAARVTDGERRSQGDRKVRRRRRAAARRRRGDEHRDARCPRYLPDRPQGAERRADLPASPGRVALRGRSRPEARTAGPGLAIRAPLERRLHDRGLEAAVAAARPRAPRGLPGGQEAAALFTWHLMGRPGRPAVVRARKLPRVIAPSRGPVLALAS